MGFGKVYPTFLTASGYNSKCCSILHYFKVIHFLKIHMHAWDRFSYIPALGGGGVDIYRSPIKIKFSPEESRKALLIPQSIVRGIYILTELDWPRRI
jgi:hypothetical protein